MTITFDKMEEEHKELYSKMWGKSEFRSEKYITNQNWTGSKSKDSFFIKTPETAKVFDQILPSLSKDLANAFELKNRERFAEKLIQACGGSGQEAWKITKMHSSSLCALLFFYDVSNENELVLSLGNGASKKTYVFNQSIFEFQNVVIKGRQPSNMDVVLIGHEEKNKSKAVVLFLESKFSEYYFGTSTSSDDISKSYLENKYGDEIYGRLLKVKVGDDDSEDKYSKKEGKDPKKHFRLSVCQKEYLDGIKQMISHYIGVCNLIDAEVVKKHACKEEYSKVAGLINEGATVLLGSIIFDDLFGGAVNQFYNDYKKNYKILTNILNDVSKLKIKGEPKVKQLTVLEEPLTYTEVFDKVKNGESDKGFVLDKKVEEYYFVNSKATTSDTSEC